MGGEAAGVATPTAPAAPANAPAPGGAPASAPSGDSGSSSQPAAAPPASDGKPTAPAADNQFDLPRPGPIAYNKYREERAQWRKQLAAQQAQLKEFETTRGRLTDYERQVKELQEQNANFTALANVIKNNPRLRAMLEEELGEGGAQPAQPAKMELPPELLEGLKGMQLLAQQIRQSQKFQADQDAQREIADVRQQVQDTLKPLLTSKGFDAEFLPQAEAYVFRRINELGEDADFEQIPFLFAEWALPHLKRDQTRMTTLVNGKREDAGLPTNPASSPPIGTAAPKHALDEVTNKRALEYVTSRMGWSG